MRISKEPEERKAEIIEAARKLFEDNGIEKTLISDIVEKIGVAKGLFYYYFKSKNDVIIAVINTILDEIDSKAQAILNNNDMSFYKKLIMFIDIYFSIYDRFSARILDELRVESNKKINQLLINSIEDLNEKYMGQIIKAGCEEKIILIHYPHEMLKMILSGITSMIRERTLDKKTLLILVAQGLNLPPETLLLEWTDTK